MRSFALELAKAVNSNFYDQQYVLVLDLVEELRFSDNQVDSSSKQLSVALARAVKAESNYKKAAATGGGGGNGRGSADLGDGKRANRAATLSVDPSPSALPIKILGPKTMAISDLFLIFMLNCASIVIKRKFSF